MIFHPLEKQSHTPNWHKPKNKAKYQSIYIAHTLNPVWIQTSPILCGLTTCASAILKDSSNIDVNFESSISNAVMHETLQYNITFIYMTDRHGGENNLTPYRKADVASWKLNIRLNLDIKLFRSAYKLWEVFWQYKTRSKPQITIVEIILKAPVWRWFRGSFCLQANTWEREQFKVVSQKHCKQYNQKEFGSEHKKTKISVLTIQTSMRNTVGIACPITTR